MNTIRCMAENLHEVSAHEMQCHKPYAWEYRKQFGDVICNNMCESPLHPGNSKRGIQFTAPVGWLVFERASRSTMKCEVKYNEEFNTIIEQLAHDKRLLALMREEIQLKPKITLMDLKSFLIASGSAFKINGKDVDLWETPMEKIELFNATITCSIFIDLDCKNGEGECDLVRVVPVRIEGWEKRFID